jgi:hypothetical protein
MQHAKLEMCLAKCTCREKEWGKSGLGTGSYDCRTETGSWLGKEVSNLEVASRELKDQKSPG